VGRAGTAARKIIAAAQVLGTIGGTIARPVWAKRESHTGARGRTPVRDSWHGGGGSHVPVGQFFRHHKVCRSGPADRRGALPVSLPDRGRAGGRV